MNRYIVNRNAQANGDHEVHNAITGCSFMPNPENQIDLGYHASCHSAVAEAKRKLPGQRVNGCYFCARPCHTS